MHVIINIIEGHRATSTKTRIETIIGERFIKRWIQSQSNIHENKD